MGAPSEQRHRIHSIDILRGLVMIIMALDHVRDFLHTDAMIADPTNLATTTPVLFFTRWITHFCAPVFVFLSGISAHIAGRRKTKQELSLFLVKRGAWLILVEVVVMTFALSFNPFYNVIFLQVLWAIGLSMVVLGLLVRTNQHVIVISGLLLVFGHNLFDFIELPEGSIVRTLVDVLLNGSPAFIPLGNDRFLAVLYTALPWTGAMLLGYGLGRLYTHTDTVRRKQLLYLIGTGVILLFVLLRAVNIYGDPAPWSAQQNGLYTFLSFINTTKYPPSLLFLCMTLGPALIFLAAMESTISGFSKILMVYGKVPFFYFILHFYIIHLLCVVLFFASGYGINDIVDPAIPFYFRPQHFGFDLWVVYLVWLVLIAGLYWPCKWFGNYKATHERWWLSYL